MRTMARRKTKEQHALERLEKARAERLVVSSAMKSTKNEGVREELRDRHKDLLVKEVTRWREWWHTRRKPRKGGR